METYNYEQSMRLFYWYIKSKLEAVAYGVKTFEKEFLDDLIYRLPDGRDVKVGDMILKQVGEGKGINLRLLGDGK